MNVMRGPGSSVLWVLVIIHLLNPVWTIPTLSMDVTGILGVLDQSVPLAWFPVLVGIASYEFFHAANFFSLSSRENI